MRRRGLGSQEASDEPFRSAAAGGCKSGSAAPCRGDGPDRARDVASASCGRSSSACRRPRSWWRDGWRGAEPCTGRTCSCSRSPTRSPGWASRSAITGCSPTAASRPRARVRALLAVLGSMAVEGPVIEWVATHRKHHRFSDQPGDPHSPHVDHGAGLARGAARPGPRARRLDVPRQGHGQPRPLRQGPARRPRPALHQPHLPALGGGRAGAPVRPRRGADRLDRRRAHRPAVGRRGADLPPAPRRPSASTRCATSSAGGRSPPATSRATSPGSRRSPSARPGTTTTTPSPPPPATASAAGSSTPAAG